MRDRATQRVAWLDRRLCLAATGRDTRRQDRDDTDPRLGSSVTAAFVDGGFDPVALPAAAGDTLTLTVQTGNAGSMSYMRTVPTDGPPIVVRTSPAPHKRDVPLNARMVIVFSEPIDAASLTRGRSSSCKRSGAAPTSVPGQKLANGNRSVLTSRRPIRPMFRSPRSPTTSCGLPR